MMKSKLKLKIVSLFLVAFSFWSAILQPDTAMALQSNIAAAFEVLPRDKIIFPEFARVEWSQASELPSKKGMIYLFQDAHTSLLAQQRITQTLLQLRKQKALDGLLIEGAAGNLTTERFDANPDFKTNPELIEKLERQGYLHGAAAYYLAKPETPSRGMESPALYRKNAELFRRVFGYQKRIQPLVSMIQVEWQRWLKTHVAGEYRDFFLNSALKHTDSADPDFFKQLLQTASDCLRMNWEILDQIEWPNLIRVQRLIQIQSGFRMDEAHLAFKHLKKDLSGKWEERLKRIELSMKAEPSVTNQATARSYRDFAADLMMDLSRRNKPVLGYRAFFDWLAAETFRNEIQPEGLIDEIEKLENQVWGTWFKKADEQSWMKLGRLAVLLDKASRLELSRREVRQFRAAVRSGEFQKWIARFAPEKKDLFARFCVRVIQFYAAAEKREAGFSKNIFEMLGVLSKVKSGDFPQIAVVLGGYHKEGLLEALKSKDLEVAVITPHLERIDHDVAYLERMLGAGFKESTLTSLPAAVISRAEVRLLMPRESAGIEAALLALIGSRAEMRDDENTSKKNQPKTSTGISRRGFGAGLTAFLLGSAAAMAQDPFANLLNREAGQPSLSSEPKMEFSAAVFPVENLQLSSASGMEGYLNGMMEKIGRNLLGLKDKWTRVFAEAELMRMNRISLMPTFSQSKGGAGMGIQIAGSSGDRLEISDGGMTMAMKTIGLLLDEILVNPVQNKSDEAAIRAAEYQYQWKRMQLAGEVAKQLIRLRSANTKKQILETYVERLTQSEKVVRDLVSAKAATAEQINTVSSFLNEAMDAQGRLEIEIAYVQEGLKLILGADFDFKTAKAPAPIRAWLNAPDSKKAALIASAQAKVGQALIVQASQNQAAANEKGAQAQARRSWFSFIFRRGPANPEKTRKELGLESKKISSDPAAAHLQIKTETEKLQAQILQQELRGLVAVEAKKFFIARDSHARGQKQVYEEQLTWRARGLLKEDYDLDRLSRLKRFVDAQLHVIDARAEMSGAAVVWAAAGIEEQSANSSNWLSMVLLSGFFPEGFKPSALPMPAKRSEVRIIQSFIHLLALTVILFLGGTLSSLAQQPKAVISGPAGTAAKFTANQTGMVWEQNGKIDMSSAAGDKPALLGLKIPEIVIVNQDGTMRLNDEAQIKYNELKSGFETSYKTYSSLKKGGAKLPTLLKEFKALLEKGLAQDRFERILAALKLAQDPNFKVIRKQAGTYGEKQVIMELVSTRVAKVQLHIPLKHLLGSKINLEINGRNAVLISPPRVVEIDTRGEAGDALVELTAVVDQPIDFSHETPFRVWLEKTSKHAAVSNHEPAEILFQNASGSEISIGVAELLRDELPVAAPSFGTAKLSEDVSAKEIKTGQMIAQIETSVSLVKFLNAEAAELSGLASAASTALGGVDGFTGEELEQLKQDGMLAQYVGAQLANQGDLTSSADGSLEISSDLAAGFPLNAGQPAAWVRTNRVLMKGTLTGPAAQLSEGDSVTARLADGRKVTGKIQSITSDNKANVFGRKSYVAEFDIPVSPDELDMSALLHDSGMSPALLFTMLAQAYRGGGEGMGRGILHSAELGGPIGSIAGTVSGKDSKPAHVPNLAQLIANDADSLNAMRLFKQHKGEFGAEDYQTLLESDHLSLTYETAKLLLLNRKDWADVILAIAAAKDRNDLPRIRAIYDAVVAALVSGGDEIEAGLKRLGVHADLDPKFRHVAESFFATLMVERGLNDVATRRLLDSEFFNFQELAQFSAELKASASPELQKLGKGISGLVWRLAASRQISSIGNSAYSQKMLNHDPEHALTWLSEEDFVIELVYRNSLGLDRRLLHDGLLSDQDDSVPSIAALIDSQTAKSVTVPKSVSSRPTELLPLPKAPVTLGELDLMTSSEQEQALRAAADRGDLELLTWILSSQASEHLRQIAVTTLQNNEHGALIFTRWFAGHQNIDRVAGVLKTYGFSRFLEDLTTMTASLEAKEQNKDVSDRSLAPERQILSAALFRLLTQEVTSLTAENSNVALRLLLMLVSDPADLGALAQGQHPLSPESFEITQLPASGYQNFAAQELARRSVLTAAAQYPELSKAHVMVGESRPGQLLTVQASLEAVSFASQPSFSGDASTMPAAMDEFIRTLVTDEKAAADLIRLTQGHYDAGWTGKVIVPSDSGVQTGLFWTGLRYLMNLLGMGALLMLLGVFIRQARTRLIKKSEMSKGHPVQFFDDLTGWQTAWSYLVDVKKIVTPEETKMKIWEKLKGWGKLLENGDAGKGHEDELMKIAAELFRWERFSLRVELLHGFRGDDRNRDKQAIFMFLALLRLHIDQALKQSALTPAQRELFNFLRDRGHRLALLSNILFHLKNLKENQSYNAVRPRTLNKKVTKERRKTYETQKRLWKRVRGPYGLNSAEDLIQKELMEMTQSYFDVSTEIGLPVAPAEQQAILTGISEEYEPEERVGQPLDNAVVAGDRKLTSRVLNLIGAAASISGLLSQGYFLWAVGWSWSLTNVGMMLLFGNVILVFPLVNYLSHLFSNRANLHDVQTEEFVNFLDFADAVISQKPSASDELISVDTPQTKEPDASRLDEEGSDSFSDPLRVLGSGALSVSADAVTTVLKTIILPSYQPPAPEAVSAPAVSSAQPKSWAERVDAWKNDAGIASVVIYVSEADQEDERVYLDQLFNRKYGFSNYRIQVVPNVSRVTVSERRELQNQILAGSAGKKVIFMRSQGIKNSQRTYGMMSEIPAEKKTPAAAQAETPVPIFNLDPVIAELNRRPAQGQDKESGLNAIVVAINESDDIAASKKLYRELLARYGYQIPLTVFKVPGTGSGNGLPTLAMMQGVTQGVEEMMREKGVSDPRVLVLSGFGPESDFMRRATGSTAFTPSVIRDDQGLPVPLAAIKIAQAVIAVRQLTAVEGPVIFDAETDTIHDHPFIPNSKKSTTDVSSGGDITFFTVEKPIQKAAKFGVPVLAGNKAGDSRRIIGFFEKARSGAKLAALINSFLALKGDAAFNETSVVNVFTGDVAVHIQDPLKREQFNQLLSLAKRELQAQADIDTDFIWDFVAIVVRAANDQQRGKKTEIERHASLGIYSLHRAQVDSRGREVTSADYERRKGIYSALHQKIYDAAFQIKNLNIHAETAQQAKLRDVRTVQAFSQLALKARFGGPGEYFRTLPDRGVVITSLNGTFPPVKEARDFYAELAHTQTGHVPVIVHGPRSETAKTPRNSLGVPRISDESLSRITDESGFPFLLDIPENQRPVYTPESHIKSDQIRDAEFLDGLYGGQNLTVQGGLQGLRQRGYVSENQISLVAPESVRGINNPVYRQAPKRAELRTLVSLAKTVRTGVLAATIIIFYGILPVNALASVIDRLAFYEPKIMQMLYQADLEVPAGSEVLLSALSTPQVKASNTLFLEAAAIPAKDLLANLEELSRAPFKVEVLFTSGNEPAFNQAREVLGGRLELRNVRIQIGANVPAMMNVRIGASIRDNADMRNQMAFAGRSSEARRARQLVSNLIALEGNNLPWSLVLEAITSPAVFNFYRNGNPHKIWSIRNVVSVLLRAAQAMARAA